ncbi:glutamate--tRNA ligase [Halobacteriovorax sp. GB3]|uniref:glutamate--tRNA ligase n=1 Tax=Halobacteriovorax sp. GB3 TaxID=2719615 RepID=UPI00235EEC9E|nr:glutamate--tRNA ligase [Halobacteriovorax sp. GB3]MDD0852239.1 glutamate--tRNA ligase [Halobacteriovorax sp. GB3]
MTVRVRFAPSPTGYLHIGGARTALYSYLFAKANNGKFILRVEDTDLERSKREYELAQVNDLKWCGIEYDEGPDRPGDYGPYRQSERQEIYKNLAEKFIQEGKAYYCFLTSEELEELTVKAEAEKKAPHTYHGKYRDLSLEEAKKKIEAGEDYVIRFKNPGKTWAIKDIVRGDVSWPVDMVGDFVIIRSNGMPVYNFCCVVDDAMMKITHVIRAEEHLNNTCRQLMIYEAMGEKAPEFAHCSLLVGEDRQKLSKRHGATSVTQYKELGYLPEALVNYLTLLGWSHPEEKDIFDINALESFDLSRLSKSPAMYDIKKLNYYNEQYLRALPVEKMVEGFETFIGDERFNSQTQEWKEKFATLINEKIQLFSEAKDFLDLFFVPGADEDEQYKEAMSWETTPQIKEYLKAELSKVEGEYATEEDVGNWMNYLKKELKIKGKPLFMGIRVCLTGRAHGPDLKGVVALSPVKVIKDRLEK